MKTAKHTIHTIHTIRCTDCQTVIGAFWEPLEQPSEILCEPCFLQHTKIADGLFAKDGLTSNDYWSIDTGGWSSRKRQEQNLAIINFQTRLREAIQFQDTHAVSKHKKRLDID